MDSGQLHLLVDGCGADIEGSAEDIWETKDVVDLVGVVRAAGGEYQVIAGGHRLGVLYLGVRIGQGKYDRAVGHRADHLLGQDVAYGKTQEYVCTDKGLRQGMHIAVSGEGPLHGVEVGAGSGDDSLAVAHDDVLAAHTQFDVEVGAGNGCGTGSVDHQPDVLYLLVLQFQGVEQACCRDDGRAVLVVVHHRDVALLLEPALYLEALGGLDVLEVYAPEGGGDGLDCGDEFFRILLIQLYVVAVQSCEYLEQQCLSFHDGLAGQCSDVAQSEDGGTVGDDGHEIALVGVFVCVLPVALDLQAWPCYSG